MTKLKKAMTAGSSVLVLLGSCVYCYILLNILSSEAPTNMSVPLQPVKPRVKHDVTPEMELASQRMEGKPAPEFSASDGQNVMHRLATELIRGPIVLVFIKEGCPCSIAAQPYFERIAHAYSTSVQFLGVIDGSPEVARAWGEKYRVSFPILADEKLTIIRDYNIDSSAHVAFVKQDRTLVRLWPGFSKAMLAELNVTIATTTYSRLRQVNLVDAPSELTTGCPFDN